LKTTCSCALGLGLLRSLLVECAESLLESFDLLLPLCHTLLVGHACVNACRLKLDDFLDSLVKQGLFLSQACVVLIDAGIHFGEFTLLCRLCDFLCAKGDLGCGLELHELFCCSLLGLLATR